MEFKITSDLAVIQNQQITANFDEVASWLDEELAPYASMAVTEDMIPTAKTYRANLRKVKERIEEYRKEAKRAALAPYSAFEAQTKVLTGKLDAAADNLDSQIKGFEAQEKAAKLAELRAVYEEGDAEAKAYLPWERLVNPKWENKGYALDAAKEEIRVALTNTAKDLETIRGIGGENTAYLLDYYKSHDLRATAQKNIELIAAKKAEEQRKAEAEARMQEATEALPGVGKATVNSGETASVKPQTVETATVGNAAVEPETQREELITLDFRVSCTRAQLAALKDFLVRSGIRYGRCQ